jgi:putative phage-type endonuclease
MSTKVRGKPPESDEQIEREKAAGIGGSEIAALVGANPYLSPFGLYARKLGLVPPPERTPAMTLGLLFEPVIASLYAREQGVELEHPGLLTLPDHPIVVGHPDFLVVADGDRAPAPTGVEVKRVGFRMAKDWGQEGSDEVPPYVICQVHWYALLTGRPIWDIPALIGGDEFKTFRVHADFELAAILVEEAEKFWREHVVPESPPKIDSSSAAKDYLKRRFPRERLEIRRATDEEWQMARQLAAADSAFEQAKASKAAIENAIKESIGDAAGIEAAGAFRITWKKTKDSEAPDWEQIAKQLGALQPPEILASMMKKWKMTKPGTRRFLPHFLEDFKP